MKKPIHPNRYNKKYYLTNCGGYEEFNESRGNKLDFRLESALEQSKIRKGENVLDIGCGRGEVAFALAKKGATVVAIDYSKDAISIAQDALQKQPKSVQKRVSFQVMNAKKLEFDDKTFSKVVMYEVWEHVHDYEQKKILAEIYRVLKKGGKAYIHTEPSKFVNDYLYPYWIYPVSSLFVDIWNSMSGKNYKKLPKPNQIRDDVAKVLHVNEPTYWQIWLTIFKSDFGQFNISTQLEYLKPIISWKDLLFNFVTQLYPLSKFAPLNIFFAYKFFITLEKQ